MALDQDQVYSLLIRQKNLDARIHEIRRTVKGGKVPLKDVVANGGEYSEKTVKSFVADVVEAYKLHFYAKMVLDGLVEDASYSEGDEPIDLTAWEILSDKDQRTFLESLLYCMVRLVAEGSPFYNGDFGELVTACDDMISSLGKGGPTFDQFVTGVAIRQLSDGPRSACTPAELMSHRSPGTITYSWFPWLELPYEGCDWPQGAFFPDLDQIYEILSGKPLVALATKAQVAKAMKEAKVHAEPESAAGGPKVKVVPPQEEWNVDDLPEDVKEGLALEIELVEIERAERAKETKRIDAWAKAFPHKDAWCKAYVAMCKAYFRLEPGLRPVGPDGALGERLWVWHVTGAFEVVRDDRRFSHFTDDVFLGLYDQMGNALIRARRLIAQRGR